MHGLTGKPEGKRLYRRPMLRGEQKEIRLKLT